MGEFCGKEWFETEQCCNCGVSFAMTADFKRRRLEDRKIFYCPAGHGQHYTGKTEAQRLKDELERKNQMLDAANARAATAEQEKSRVSKSHKIMRARIVNGVCPCCNRTFQNLLMHMKSEHPDFKAAMSLQTLRNSFGMTQAAVAAEAGVHPVHVSLYERERPVSARAKQRISDWLDRHDGATK